MPEPAFLVEGRMEQFIVQRLCPGKPVRIIGCNGDDTPLERVAHFIHAQMQRLKRSHPVIILLDKEKRPASCAEIRADLSRRLDQLGYADQYILGIADNMTENWILASWDSVQAAYPSLSPYNGPIENCDGKRELRRLLPSGSPYHETTNGVDYFLQCDVQVMYRRSESFRHFADALTIACHWLTPLRERPC